MASPRIAITGLGFVGAVGAHVSALEAALDQERSGLGDLTLFDSELSREYPVGQYRGDLPSDFAELVRPLSAREAGRLSRSDLLALVAAAEALQMAALPEAARRGAGVYLGQSVCGTLSSESYYLDCAAQAASHGRASPSHLDRLFVHDGANSGDAIAREFGMGGPMASLMTACSSGANALGLAANRIACGQAEVMLAGGADSLSRIAFLGFAGLGVMSPEGPRPFDAARKGMCVGEGAGLLVLESEAHARARRAPVLAWLTGYGHSCDAHHLTAPHPEGLGAQAAMNQALADAGLAPSDIGFVSAHGTGTLDNDKVEALAITRVFGPRAVPVSSTKRYFGHTLAASGAIKAVLCVLALQRRRLWPNLGLRTAQDDSLDLVLQARPAPQLQHVLSNSFGFGGNNAALVFSAGDRP
ncbi:beta-ketoacyl-[acyl-carrier-protein] synthase family protein [bacterium]|nr:MAG: beta-ketoacyl-[acyl-carrier-protein] synthase family protein [bacterium]RIK62734.1 MAG: beta-ketoacyl-[acyl-carrier-protein] synthase II [Planctomycetota bacterium]